MFSYVEDVKHESDVSWYNRRTAVYQRFSKHGNSFCIIFHPRTDTQAYKRLGLSMKEEQSRKTLCQNPFNVHFLLFSSYFGNWTYHIKDLGKSFLEMVRTAHWTHTYDVYSSQSIFRQTKQHFWTFKIPQSTIFLSRNSKNYVNWKVRFYEWLRRWQALCKYSVCWNLLTTKVINSITII